MSRFSYNGVVIDGNGHVILGATISVYLANTTTPASIYTALAGGVAVNSVTSDASDGHFLFYIDNNDYGSSQTFDVTASKTGYRTVTQEDVAILPSATGFGITSEALAADLSITFNNSYAAGMRYFINPGGADRLVTPDVTFPTGYEIIIINTGGFLLTFDPAGLDEAVAPGEKVSFFFDGTSWR